MGAPASRLRGLRQLAALCVLAQGCGAPFTPVDLHVDLDGDQPAEAAFVRLCVAGGAERQYGSSSGRYVLTGLVAEGPVVLTVDLLDEDEEVIGRFGPEEIREEHHVVPPGDCETPVVDDRPPCAVPCTGGPEIPAENEESRVLGARFLGAIE